jgi:hypothetical protein
MVDRDRRDVWWAHRIDEAEMGRAGWGDTNETGSHRDAIRVL